MTLHDAISRFTRHLQANGCSPHTVRSYACDLRGLERFLEGGIPVKQVSAHALATFLTSPDALHSASGKPKGPGAVNRLRAVLCSFFRWLVETGQIRNNPAATLRVRSYRQPAPKMLLDTDRNTLLTAMEESHDPLALRDRAIVELMLGTGIRLAEAVALDVGDVDLASGAITIHPKGGGKASRYLNRRVRSLLKCHLAWKPRQSGDCSALFTTSRGTRITARHVHRRLGQWLRKAGIDAPLSPHALRHTLAVKLLKNTGNLRLVQRALGHASIASTVRYTHVPDDALAAALEEV